LKKSSEELPFSIEVVPAEGQKCHRCWLVSPTVGLDSDHPGVCARCEGVLSVVAH
jgi:isoleucyl-tRNA synthetase